MIRSQSADPRRVAFGAILAPSEVVIGLRSPSGSAQQLPSLEAACEWMETNTITVAEPAIRLAWLARQFATRGAIGSICNADQRAAMTTMGINARRAMGDPCVEDDVDLARCEAAEEIDGVETPLIACESPTQTQCYELAIDPETCPNGAHRKLVVHRGAAAPMGYDLLRCR
ncbi:hypothetical protein BH11MYX1_BH11MYX1_54970 [soil metagenome]